MDNIGPIGITKLLGVVATVLSTIGGFVYWLARSSVGLATKSYVENQLTEEIDPLERRVENALDHARQNEDELEQLKSLIEGGNNQFDQGMMDFLDENIERTNEIKGELDELRQRITTLKYDDRTGNPSNDER
ncbi:hypothetical protein [Halorussus sp. MSC15.2]|uniref:hypothetical protein n=1 Tax=Halorussus sp. MSC15.2 TaxID=2283638 RepID=UPI0013D76EF4|nr:hypothetical protein [Halorussus sp. MSC15.2]NEU58618.1 hypothetical protein [Halorussus sp. MSC15.2]